MNVPNLCETGQGVRVHRQRDVNWGFCLPNFEDIAGQSNKELGRDSSPPCIDAGSEDANCTDCRPSQRLISIPAKVSNPSLDFAAAHLDRNLDTAATVAGRRPDYSGHLNHAVEEL